MTTPLKPIGYYLKALDALITEDFARTLSAYELTRRDWQVLNSLALQGPLARPELSRLLRPFWKPGARTLDEVAGALIARGLLAADGDALALTEAGRRTRAEVARLVEAGRARLMRGLTDDDYLRTVTVLDRMTANLTPGCARAT
ncbi:MarR family winged helix-turn-helix transcriptional regulator [Streptomyces platensis]|uniref:MarR family winged helix-turn-helix transcriptional regulator n=1 Tax=Streptomyces platensis TaxID=58346 RepID=UPI003C303631